MINNKSIAVIVPAFNEESQIRRVLETMPDFVDRILVVNDCSTDSTQEIIEQMIPLFGKRQLTKEVVELDGYYSRALQLYEEAKKEEIKYFPAFDISEHSNEERLILINLKKNSGVGAAIATGYKWCKDNEIDCSAVMAGDGQMDPAELESICNPVVFEEIDYVKGNRLNHHSAWLAIPKVRFFGNSILSILTKIASGYWHVSDTQTGYTAASKKALNSIRLYKIYRRYGMPNDMLVKLNIAKCVLKEVDIKPVYFIGEQSKMKIRKVIPRVSMLLLKSFFKRLWMKYLFKEFHPLFLFYNLSFILGLVSMPYLIKIIRAFLTGTTLNYEPLLAFLFLFISGFQSFLFAMWMDIQDNERLYK